MGVFGLEVIAPQVQQHALYVHFHTTSSKTCSTHTRTCQTCAQLIQLNVVATRGSLEAGEEGLHSNIEEIG
jgi:hypothetical protein